MRWPTPSGGQLEWHAYLSTLPHDGAPAVHARDRIGRGPWFNAKGVEIADDVADLPPHFLELGPQLAGLQPGEPPEYRRERPVLLLRGRPVAASSAVAAHRAGGAALSFVRVVGRSRGEQAWEKAP